MTKKLNLNEGEIVKLYRGKILSSYGIAKIFGCSSTHIQNILKRNNIPRRTRKLNLNEEEIIRLYRDEKISTYKIANRFNCSCPSILDILKKHGIEIYPNGFFNKDRPSWNKGLTKEDPRVWKNISERSRLTQFKKGLVPITKGKTFEEVYGVEKAKLINRKINETKKRLFKEGKLKAWNKGKPFLALEKNPRWLGGKSFEPYTPEFNKEFKDTIRERDKYICLKCERTQEEEIKEFKRKLSIHHINYLKELTILQNCCTLCLRCNIEVNKNRPHWTKFFQSLLSEKYNYQYSEKREIILEVT